MEHCAIIGFGCAGYHAAKQLRRLRPDDEIHVFEQTVRGGANPMLTTYYAGGKITYDQMFPFGNMEDICRDLSLKLVAEPVARVEANKRQVITADGISRQYDKILIATGASALLPAFIKVDGRQVFLMRTVQDAELLKKYVEQHEIRSAAVIGASMVGIKVAELLHHRGIDTHLLDAADRIFPLAAYPSFAREITAALEKQGLQLKMGVRVSGADPRGVVFADESVLQTDLVCLCIGTRANTELVANTQVADGTGIEINRGIVVNTQMETSVPGIYAAGDCCEGYNIQTGQTMIIGLWANAAAQGQCAGSNMAGVPEEYYGNFPHNITRFFGMTFVGLGDPNVPGEYREFCGERIKVGVVLSENRIVSMNIFGDCAISGVLKCFLIKKLGQPCTRLSTTQQGLMEKAGLPHEFIAFIGDGRE